MIANEYANRWDERYAKSPLVWSTDPNATVVEELGSLAPGRALELGCGEGRNAIWLAGQGWSVTAVDFSTVGVEKGRARATEMGIELEWVAADAAEYRPEPGAYDLLLACFMHTSPDERQRWLAHAASALKAGGVFLYIGHDRSNIEHGRGGPQDPAIVPSASDLAQELNVRGQFDIEKAVMIKRAVTAERGHRGGGPKGNQQALDAVVRAIRRDSA